LDIRPPTVGLFSFNNPLGACPDCRGFGRTIAIDLNKAIPDRSLSIKQGVVRVFRGVEFGESQKDLLRACAREDIDINVPFEELPKADQNFVIEGERRSGEYTDEDYEDDRWYGVRGFFRWLESKTYKMHVRVLLSRYRAYVTCPKCDGGRYQPATLNYKIVPAVSARRNGARTAPPHLTLSQFQALSISDARDLLRAIECSPNDKTAQMLRDEICARLNYLCEVGVGYLTLDRSTRTLSGGEVQRVNLTTCLGTRLVNTLFVLDEPSVGLHPRDTERLVRILQRLRDAGNTVVVVEHEASVMRAANQIVDLGPGHGATGGEVVFQGSFSELLKSAESITGQYLSGRKKIEIPQRRPVQESPIHSRRRRKETLISSRYAQKTSEPPYQPSSDFGSAGVVSYAEQMDAEENAPALMLQEKCWDISDRPAFGPSLLSASNNTVCSCRRFSRRKNVNFYLRISFLPFPGLCVVRFGVAKIRR
jgi:excinuclease ABC subunit A